MIWKYNSHKYHQIFDLWWIPPVFAIRNSVILLAKYYPNFPHLAHSITASPSSPALGGVAPIASYLVGSDRPTALKIT